MNKMLDKSQLGTIEARAVRALRVKADGCGTHQAMEWFNHYCTDILVLMGHIEAQDECIESQDYLNENLKGACAILNDKCHEYERSRDTYKTRAKALKRAILSFSGGTKCLMCSSGGGDICKVCYNSGTSCHWQFDYKRFSGGRKDEQ